MKKMFVGNISANAREDDIRVLFSEYGTVRSCKLIVDVFSGKCKGFGFIEMEGHEARAAIAGLNGKMIDGKSLKVVFENTTKNGKHRRH